MSLHFIKLKVKEVRQETADCVSIAFDIPEQLKETFRYKQGQYVTVRAYINGKETRRSYSLCSSPLENEWRVAVKKVEQGLFSTYANNRLKAGDEIELMPPLGKFYTGLHPSQQKNYVAIAAGSGITPILSIIKTVVRTEPHSNFMLVYGNKNRNSIIFKEALEALKNKYMERFRLVHVLSRERTDADINFGRIDENKLIELSKLIELNNTDEFFICGPEAMICSVKDFLEDRNIDRKKIHSELFTSTNQKPSTVNYQPSTEHHSPKSRITVKSDGRSFDFNLAFDSNTILDAALQQGADLPYACKGGVCCTCRAKLIEGEVRMDANYALAPEELEQGFILSCQSHPKTERVVIDYDVK